MQLGWEVSRQDYRAPCYALLGKKVEASNEMITHTILVNNRTCNVLFHSGSIYSYVSIRFA